MYEILKKKIKRSRRLSTLYRKLIKADIYEQKFMDLEQKIIYDYIYKLEQRVENLEQIFDIPQLVPKVLPTTDEFEPNLNNPTSQIATASQLSSDIFRLWCERLALPAYPNRKTWEYVYICQVLEKMHLIKPGIKGIGFGVGKDPIVAYFVKNKMEILATDLDEQLAKEKGWVDTNQFSRDILDLNERGIVTDSELRSMVTLEAADMNQIPSRYADYDFTWSACAFEHLGSIELGLEFVKNSLQCLKPGGVAIHTTEYNVSSNDETVDNAGTVLFRRKDIEILANDVRAMGHIMDVNFNTGNSSFDKYYDIAPYSDYTHLKLQIDKYITTSIGIIITRSS